MHMLTHFYTIQALRHQASRILVGAHLQQLELVLPQGLLDPEELDLDVPTAGELLAPS